MVLTVTLLGCGGEKNTLGVIPATGIVKVDGVPMKDVHVIFIPVSGDSRTAGSYTDDKGEFELVTPGSALVGCMPGEYNVTFEKTEMKGTYPDIAVTHLIPQKYGDPKISGIAPVKIERGKKNRFEFELQSK
jgi:hypothetical protein